MKERPAIYSLHESYNAAMKRNDMYFHCKFCKMIFHNDVHWFSKEGLPCPECGGDLKYIGNKQKLEEFIGKMEKSI